MSFGQETRRGDEIDCSHCTNDNTQCKGKWTVRHKAWLVPYC